MTEITPILKHKGADPPNNAAYDTRGEVEGKEEECLVHEAKSEIPLLEIVRALFQEWLRNGANENLTPQDIMAMHLQYRQVTRGRQVFHPQHAIMGSLARAMLRWKVQTQILIDDIHVFQLGSNILRNLRENWSRIIQLDVDLPQNLNVYRPPSYRERFQRAWRNSIRECTARKDFIFQVFLPIILLIWPLSLLFMGYMYLCLCSKDIFLAKVVVLVGLLGMTTLSLRLLLVFTEKFWWLPTRSMISHFWKAMKLLECISLLVVMILLWGYIRDPPSFEFEDPSFCIKTFYTFMFWMKYISSVFSVVWLATNFWKAIVWLKRCRYQYRPLFDDESEMYIL